MTQTYSKEDLYTVDGFGDWIFRKEDGMDVCVAHPKQDVVIVNDDGTVSVDLIDGEDGMNSAELDAQWGDRG